MPSSAGSKLDIAAGIQAMPLRARAIVGIQGSWIVCNAAPSCSRPPLARATVATSAAGEKPAADRQPGKGALAVTRKRTPQPSVFSTVLSIIFALLPEGRFGAIPITQRNQP
jgi:hypothetical protein